MGAGVRIMIGYPAMESPQRERVPQNAPGDFYVERHVCTRCCIPHGEAPELLDDPEEGASECYFRRQPQNDAEVERACQVVWISCVGGPRYGGNDPEILARLRELGVAHQCDQLPESGPYPRPVPQSLPLLPKRSWWRRLFGGAG